MNQPQTDLPASETAAQKPSWVKRWLLIALALALLFVVLIYLDEAEDNIDVQQSEQPPALQVVTVQSIQVAPEQVQVSAYAEVRPRWSAVLRAAVSGRIEEVYDSALAGEQVAADTPLIRLENSHHLAEVAAAELAVREARLNVSKAEKNTSVARQQFKRSGSKPPNELAIHLPEQRIAKAALKSARARLKAIELNLQHTTIKAPFSGFVTERMVSLGQTVNVGDTLVKLVDDTTFEITAEIGRRDWRLLQQPLSGAEARILDQEGREIARASIRQGGGFLDEQTRQYQIFLVIQQTAEQDILPGDFVRILLPGIQVDSALNIPASALSQEGLMWYVDAEDRLQKVQPKVIFRLQDRVIVQAPEGSAEWRVAITPLLSFLPGQQVQAQSAE